MNRFKVASSLICLILITSLSFGQSTCTHQMQFCFEGNANDVSGNGYNGTVVNAVLTSGRNGNANSAYEFNGASSYIAIPSDSAMVDEYTFSAWIYNIQSLQYGETRGIVSLGAYGKNQSLYLFNTSAGQGVNLTSYRATTGEDNVAASTLLSLNTWYHIACTRGNDSMKIYINGILKASKYIGNVSAGYTLPAQSSIGARHRSHQFWKGKIDDVAIHTCALTDQEIYNLYNASSYCEIEDAPCSEVAQYCFEGNAIDETGNGHNGVVNNVTLTTGRKGDSNSAYNFNGSASYITFPANSFTFDEFTYSAWVRTSENPNNTTHGILNIGNSGGDHYLFLGNTSSGSGFGLTSYSNGQVARNVLSGSLPSLNTWYHVVAVRSDTEIQVYVNGVLEAATSVVGMKTNYTFPMIGKIGARVTNETMWRGEIDDVTIYNCALSPVEIADLYNSSGYCSPEAQCNSEEDIYLNATHQYCFDNSVYDNSGNYHHGTNNNASFEADRHGSVVRSLDVTGSGDYVSIPASSLINKNQYSYGMWTKLNSLPAYGQNGYLISVGGLGGDQILAVCNTTSRGFCASSYSGSGVADVAFVDSLPDTSKWYHVVVTRSKTDLKVYVDGILAVDTAVSDSVANYGHNLSNAEAIIGARYNHMEELDGYIDDVALFDYALNDSEVMCLYLTTPVCSSAGSELAVSSFRELASPVVSVLPNPSNGVFTVKIDNLLNGVYTFELFDIKGQQLSSTHRALAASNERIELDYSSIGSGTYFLRVTSGNQVTVKRVVIQ